MSLHPCRSARFDYAGDGGQKRNLDHKKAKDIERLGMGIGIGHVRCVFIVSVITWYSLTVNIPVQ